MPLSVADIAKLAFDGVGRGITGVVHDCTLCWAEKGAYDIATGKHQKSPLEIDGRAIEDVSRPIADIFPEYTKGPSDTLVMLEGLIAPPEEGMQLFYDQKTLTVLQVADVAGGGGLYYVVAR